jgi:predicted GNAT superfamily acetyltransferase
VNSAEVPDVVLRPFESRTDYEQGVTLQRDTWGQEFTECVPASILQISHKVGGVVAGAFDAHNTLVGFVFGISGLRDGRPAHWSHMLAVRPEYRGQRLGMRLKAFQRQLMLDAGIDVIYWTYDPLIAGNAHLNINLLGARPIQYVPDMYGGQTGSELHSGLGTDRFVVEWRLRDPDVERSLAGETPRESPPDGHAVTVDAERGELLNQNTIFTKPSVRVAIPLDIQSVKRADPETAHAWRAVTRDALLQCLGRGYHVTGFRRDRSTDRGYYYLSADMPRDNPP